MFKTELSLWNNLMLKNLNKPRGFWADDLSDLGEKTAATKKFLGSELNVDFDWFRLYFSADKRYLIVLETANVAKDLIRQKCVVYIYKNSLYKERFALSFRLVATVGVYLGRQLKPAMCSYPSYLILAPNRLNFFLDSTLEVAFIIL